MERVVSATEARAQFGELMRRVVEDNERVIVECDGEPRVIVLSVEDFHNWQEDLRGREPWEVLLDRVHARILAELGDRKLPPPEDIVRQMREERDAQLLDNLR